MHSMPWPKDMRLAITDGIIKINDNEIGVVHFVSREDEIHEIPIDDSTVAQWVGNFKMTLHCKGMAID